MADFKVSALPVLAAGDLDPLADHIMVSDTSAGVSKRMAPAELIRASLPYLSSFYDFMTGILPPTLSFTRASTGWYFNNSVALAAALSDVPRFSYNRTTGAAQGLLIEEAHTNSVRNSTMVGAAAGTPGTAPTNWSITGSVNGLTREIVGIGTEDGIDYIDIKFSGTPSASSTVTVHPEGGTQAAALAAQVWYTAWFMRVVAGSLTNVSNITHRIVEVNSGGGEVVGTTAAPTPTGAALKTQRVSIVRTLTDATTAFVHAYFSFAYTNGSAIDVTFRFGLPQLVRGTTNVSTLGRPIRTSTAAVTRAADICRITNPAALSSAVYIVKARTPTKLVASAGRCVMLQVDDGTANNLRSLHYDTGVIWALAITGGVTQALLNLGAVAEDTDFTLAARFADNLFAASLNGAAIVTDTSGTNPLGLTIARVGVDHDNHYWGSTIKTIELRRTATDAELPLLAA